MITERKKVAINRGVGIILAIWKSKNFIAAPFWIKENTHTKIIAQFWKDGLYRFISFKHFTLFLFSITTVGRRRRTWIVLYEVYTAVRQLVLRNLRKYSSMISRWMMLFFSQTYITWYNPKVKKPMYAHILSVTLTLRWCLKTRLC